MKEIKNIFLLCLLFMISNPNFSQKQTFDVVSYTMPKTWQQQKSEFGIQLSVMDTKTGVYAIAVITKAIASNALASDNFTTDWNKLVKGTVQVTEEPTMQPPVNQNGWEIISGSANYTDAATTGVATLITATGGGQMVSAVFMTNTQQYQTDLVTLINSLELSKASSITTSTTSTNSGGGKTTLVGIWGDNLLETSGYANGYPQYSGGYMRKEYAFYPDGTYLFRHKVWQVFLKEILFVYESGTYSVNGNQLTITPKQGKGGWWSKAASGRTSEWGARAKSSEYKMEKTTYAFEIKYYPGSKDNSLILKPGKSTQRDGESTDREISYTLREDNTSIIDNPPGVKTGFENKSFRNR
jgi:hypothetical protein